MKVLDGFRVDNSYCLPQYPKNVYGISQQYALNNPASSSSSFQMEMSHRSDSAV